MWLPLAIWIAICGACFVYALFGRLSRPSWNTSLGLIALAAIIARLIPIMLYPDPLGFTSIDIDNFAATAQAVLDRRDVYELPVGVHPYPPLQMYIFAGAKALADALDASFFVLVRIPQAAAEVATALLVAAIVRKSRGEDDGWRFGLAYALCPLPILVTVYHGQFDAVSVFFAVLAFWAIQQSADNPTYVALSAAALALGAMGKMWPALLLPVMLAALPGVRPRVIYAAVFASVCAALVAIYVVAFSSSPRAIFDAIDGYVPIFPTAAGLGLVIDRTFGSSADSLLTTFQEHGTLWSACAALAASATAIALRLSLARSIVLVLAVLLLTTPSSEAYHLIWIIPFAFVAGDRAWPVAIVATSGVAYAMVMLLGVGLFIPPVASATAEFLLDRSWWLEYARWVVMAAWVCVMLWDATESRRQQPRLAS